MHQIIDKFETRVTWFLFIQKKRRAGVKDDEYCSVGVWSGDMPWFGSSGLGLCANQWKWHENFQIHYIFVDRNRRPVFADPTQSTKNGERTQCNPDYWMRFRIGVNRNLFEQTKFIWQNWRTIDLSHSFHRFNMALYCNLKLNMFVVAACLNTNSDGARKLLEQCNPKHFLLVELDIRKSASILHIEKTIINLLASDSSLGMFQIVFRF